jgi:YD repeat-containing protein
MKQFLSIKQNDHTVVFYILPWYRAFSLYHNQINNPARPGHPAGIKPLIMRKLLFILIASAGLVSCSKEKNDNSGIIALENVPKYKTVTFGTNTTTYTYDPYGRQVLELQNDGSKVETYYASGKVTRKIFDASGAYIRTITIELRADGLREKDTYSDLPGNYVSYEYNAGKTIAKSISKSATDIIESVYFYSNGNMDSTQYFKNGVRYLTNKYTYYPDQPLVQLPANSGISWYGADKKNMVKTLTHVLVNGTTIVENYSYEYDSAGRLTILTQTGVNGASSGYYTYY